MTTPELRQYWRDKYAAKRATGWKRTWGGPGGTKPKPSAARKAIDAMRSKRK